MHRARGRILVEPTMDPSTASEAQGGAVASKPPEPEPAKLQSLSVSVLEPSKSRVKDGKIRLFSVGRTRSSSTRSSTGSVKGWWSRDVWVKAELYLTPTTLHYKIEGMGECEFLLEDLIGIQVTQTAPTTNPTSCEFNIHLFPIISNPTARNKVRKLCMASILFDSSGSFVENLRTASQWKTDVLLQAQRAAENTFGAENMSRESCEGSLEVSEKQSVLVARKFLVFINPVAGSQQGVALFDGLVKPMLDIAEVNYRVEITERQNHAREMIKTIDLNKIDGIVLSSGDGLLYEVVNGIMERSDWERAIKIPIGMLPTGSGNALCASTLFESGEPHGLEYAAFQIIRGGVVPLDMATVELSNGTSTYMTLLAGWGIVADIDIESEKFRKLGKSRFLLGALSSIVKKKVYRGRLSYLPTEGVGGEPKEVTIETQDPNAEETASKGSSEDSEGPKENSTGESPPPLRQLASNEVQTNVAESTASVPLNRPSTDLLVPLDKPLPNTWTTKDDNFLSVTPILIPYLSSDFFGDREFTMGTGSMRLLWVDGNITRKGVFNMVTSAETGKHTELDEVYKIDVKAFRLEPLSPPGIMTVDGEVVSYGKMQAQVHPQLARVMSRRRKS